MKNGLKIILVLAAFVVTRSTSYAQNQVKINGDYAEFEITTKKSFTLTFVDTSDVHEVILHLVYNSKDETYKIDIVKNAKTGDSVRTDSIDKFTLYDPIIYQELKNTINKVAQNKFDINAPVTETSVNAIYLWLHHIRHFDDKAPMSGELILNEYVLVMKDKGVYEQNKNYHARLDKVLREANNYSAAIASIDNQRQKERFLSDQLLSAIKADSSNISSLLADNTKTGKIKALKETLFEISKDLRKTQSKMEKVEKDTEKLIKQKDAGDIDEDEFDIQISILEDSFTKHEKRILNLEDSSTETQERIALYQSLINDSKKHKEVLAYLDKYISKVKQGGHKEVLSDFQIFGEKLILNDSINFLREHYTDSLREYYYSTRRDVTRLRSYDEFKKLPELAREIPHIVEALMRDRHSDLIARSKLDRIQVLLSKYADKIKWEAKYQTKGWSAINDTIEKITVRSKKHLKSLVNDNIFKIDKVALQFERGFLERIQVWVTFNDRQEIFENVYAIGFSSISNYKTFKDVKLFARNSSVAYPYIFLSDVIANYDNLLRNYTRDYCPADTAINNANPSGNDKILKLRSERLVNLFDSKIYTDLRGIAEDEPNGLVQIEVNKRFNMNTSRRQVSDTRNNFGYFNYMNVWGALTKIEKEDRILPLRNDRIVQNNTLLSPSYATTLDFRKYEILSTGVDINLLLFDRPDTKFTLYADFGTRYGYTKVRDSVLRIVNSVANWDSGRFNEREAHTLTLFPRISAEIFAQKRVGFTLAYQYNYSYLFSNNYFKQVASYAKSQTSNLLLDTRARGYHMMELYMRIQVAEDDDNKFFIRARLFLQRGDVNTSFSQLQLGYSYNLFYKK